MILSQYVIMDTLRSLSDKFHIVRVSGRFRRIRTKCHQNITTYVYLGLQFTQILLRCSKIITTQLWPVY